MIDSYINLFCSVLRAGLWNKVPDADMRGADFNRIWVDAQKQAVSGLVAQGLINTSHMHPKTLEVLQRKILSIAAMSFKISHILADAVKALRNSGIEPILLKGHGVASYYHQPLLRECGDIDLYVRHDEYRRAFDILGERLKDVEEKEFEVQGKHSHLVIRGIPIELHQFSDVLPRKYNNRYQDISDTGLSSNHQILSVDNIRVRTPEPTFNTFFVFNHFWRHFIAVGVGFRQVCDWVVLLHSLKNSIDRDRLSIMLESLDLMKPWKAFSFIAVDLLGLPEEEMPFYDSSCSRLSRKIIQMMMREGNLGHERKERWMELGYPFLDKAKVFIVSTWRYMIMLFYFGGLAWHEYFFKLRNYIRL
jgi:hypothetical protein